RDRRRGDVGHRPGRRHLPRRPRAELRHLQRRALPHLAAGPGRRHHQHVRHGGQRHRPRRRRPAAGRAGLVRPDDGDPGRRAAGHGPRGAPAVPGDRPPRAGGPQPRGPHRWHGGRRHPARRTPALRRRRLASPAMTRTRPGVAGALLVLLLALACSGPDEPDIALPGEGAGAPADSEDDGDEPAVDPLLGETFHVAQAVDDTLVVREAAQPTSDELVTLSAADEVSGTITCLVEQQVGDWLQVRLPTGPPDRTGWVARDDVTLSRHRFHIEVSLGERTLTLYTGEIEALSVPVAVGPDAPEAGEERYIKELVQVPAQAPTYGRFAYGLSGSSTTFEA